MEATPARLAQEIIASKTMLERVEGALGLRPERLAADKAYGTGPFLGWLSERKISPHIPVLDRQHQTDGLLPRDAFIFDSANNYYICPQGKILKHRRARTENRIHIYRATARDCKSYPTRQQCTRGTKRTLSVPYDESARQDAAALQTPKLFNASRQLRKKWRRYTWIAKTFSSSYDLSLDYAYYDGMFFDHSSDSLVALSSPLVLHAKGVE